jgi:alkanesulfonate monooxygenase SsuD/methylene tetrahydromethanopterin reductase-like flavin-dependent oxidoreductase (luciferase family)
VKVGLMLPQAPEDGAGTWREIRALAEQAEAGGADSLWVSDHFLYRPGDGKQTGYHEAWSLVSAVAASTQRVQVGPLVLATSFRPPGILAKMAATTDDVADGRLILGLGCGWHEPEYVAFGYPFDHRVDRFEEALEIIVRLLREGSVTFQGRWYTLDDAFVEPRSPHRTPILVAARRPRMMRISARLADAWQTAWYGLPDAKFAAEHEALRAACEAEGRDPSTLEMMVGLTIGASDPETRHIALDPGAIAEGLAAWAAIGVGHVQLGIDPTSAASYDRVLEGIGRFRSGRAT